MNNVCIDIVAFNSMLGIIDREANFMKEKKVVLGV